MKGHTDPHRLKWGAWRAPVKHSIRRVSSVVKRVGEKSELSTTERGSTDGVHEGGGRFQVAVMRLIFLLSLGTSLFSSLLRHHYHSSLFVSGVRRFTSPPFVREAAPTGRGKTLTGYLQGGQIWLVARHSAWFAALASLGCFCSAWFSCPALPVVLSSVVRLHYLILPAENLHAPERQTEGKPGPPCALPSGSPSNTPCSETASIACPLLPRSIPV